MARSGRRTRQRVVIPASDPYLSSRRSDRYSSFRRVTGIRHPGGGRDPDLRHPDGSPDLLFRRAWIPAFAGMTDLREIPTFAGMTGCFVGMTGDFAGMTNLGEIPTFVGM